MIESQQASTNQLRDIIVNSTLFGLCYTTQTIITNGSVLVAVICAVGSLLYNGDNAIALMNKLSFKAPSARAWSILLVLNVLLLSFGFNGELGFGTSLRIFIQQCSLLFILAGCISTASKVGYKYLLVTVAIALVFAGGVNQIASTLNYIPISKSNIQEVEERFRGRFAEGGSRWVSPLTNHWQLSGILRWSLPILVLALHRSVFGSNKAIKLMAIAAALATMIILYRLQFRNAAFPLVFVSIWLIISKQTLRDILSVVACIYSIACPFLYSSAEIQGLLLRLIEFCNIKFFSTQNFEDYTRFSGRVDLWSAFIYNISNIPLLMGMGHRDYDALNIIGGLPLGTGMDPYTITHLQFHQSFLDIIGIYGLIPTAFLALLLCRSIATAIGNRTSRAARKPLSDNSLALLSLALAFISMSKDSFVKEDNIFYIIIFISIIGVRNEIDNPDYHS